MNLYDDQFSEAYDFPTRTPVDKTLIIASTPRSGSHMLGHALQQTGQFGFPLEYLNRDNHREWQRRLGITKPIALLKEIQHRRTSPNGVFGIKLHWDHANQPLPFIDLLEQLPNAYFVLLRRSDVLMQAISWTISAQTGIWIHGQKGEQQKASYDADRIDLHMKKAVRDTAEWRYTLAATGCKVLEVNFDEAKNNIAATISRIAEFAGVDIPEDKLTQEHVTRSQQSTTNLAWRDQFLLERMNSVKPLFREPENEHKSTRAHCLKKCIKCIFTGTRNSR